ncbi:MAG: phosphoethanolamine transferase [Prosthecobacter sp.]|uniref:phosphoethanolamine transferase n=1 Tax=Prosthecobacter sp. TaxID=1965333 RepID=UPI0019E62343|nr:phosphoethanolamine transferase [Prosthecobacter sp.]MBE2282243.1 phosphoethanolamine transferase [Prosthecobacter sp.]
MRARCVLWLATPLLLLGPISLACLLTIQNLPTTFLFLALLETNQTEISAFQMQAILTMLGTVLLLLLYVWVVKNRVPSSFRFGLAGRSLILSVLVVPALYDLAAHGPTVCVAAFKQRCLTSFPGSTLYSAYEAWDMRARVQNRKDLTASLRIEQEPEFRQEKQRQVHMLVIGESATKSCFGLYGYDRETTPLLERTPGLLPFRDVACTATVTLAAVPALVTATMPGKVLEATQQPSLLSAYRQAGFRVYWLSAQRKHGTFDTVTSLFSEDANEAVFKGGKFDTYGDGAYSGTSDMNMLPLVRKVLQRNEPKVLIVVHAIGSHGPYPARYGSKEARFPAEKQAVMKALLRIASGLTSDPKDLKLAQNSYDNTICATDTLLANLIHDLKAQNASSWFCYVSDHGENTSKALLGKFMHGMITRQVVEVPMLMWLSPQYEQAHTARAQALKANLATPFSASCTFHTALDLGGISCEGFKPEWSCASARFKPGPRLVCDANGRITDYDVKFPPVKSVATPAKTDHHVSARTAPAP